VETPSKTWFVIVNPASGSGSSKKKWPKIKYLLEKHGFNFHFAFTQYSKHESVLVQEAIKSNIKHIISVGGDGTLHQIVNGIFAQNLIPASNIKVGVIPIGTGNDWVKTYGIPKHIESAIKLIKVGHIAHQDIGKITFLNSKNPEVYFNNSAGIGFDGYVVSKVEAYKRLGAFAYLYGALASIFSFRNFNCKIPFENDSHLGETFMISVGICRFSGGGMQLTSSPNPFDGNFDISIAKDFNLWDILKNLPKLFNGKIDNIKKVNTLKNNKLNVVFQQDSLPLIQADGELIGTGNIEIIMIPKAFSFFTLKKPKDFFES